MCIFLLKLVHSIVSGHFISGCGRKGIDIQSLRFSGMLAAFSPIASFRRMKAFRFAIGETPLFLPKRMLSVFVGFVQGFRRKWAAMASYRK